MLRRIAVLTATAAIGLAALGAYVNVGTASAAPSCPPPTYYSAVAGKCVYEPGLPPSPPPTVSCPPLTVYSAIAGKCVFAATGG